MIPSRPDSLGNGGVNEDGRHQWLDECKWNSYLAGE